MLRAYFMTNDWQLQTVDDPRRMLDKYFFYYRTSVFWSKTGFRQFLTKVGATFQNVSTQFLVSIFWLKIQKLVYCKFDLNKFVSLETRTGCKHTNIYTIPVKHVFSSGIPQNGCFHETLKIDSFKITIGYFVYTIVILYNYVRR